MKSAFLPGLLLLVSAINYPLEAEDPAPNSDRVGFPKDYQTQYKLVRLSENSKDKHATLFLANEPATHRDTKTGEYPYGSVLVMEVWKLALDDSGNPLTGTDGHLRRDSVEYLHVMRKEKGFGETYQQNRSGEWEFVQYAADGSYITPPGKSAKCAACHATKAGSGRDYSFEPLKK